MTSPYIEKQISEDFYLRTFKFDVNDMDLLWHRDKEDRIIEPTHKTDWKFQIDDQLPQNIENQIFIEKSVYHRLIKGTGDLVLKIRKIN